jgi:uncharacterized protein (DUF488 family)
MLYTIGYQGMKSTAELIQMLIDNGVTDLVDVRSKPYSRFHYQAFDRDKLKPVIESQGIRYIWKGDILGGFGSIKENALEWLFDFHMGRRACVMCFEQDPDQCHRKNEIARRLAPRNVEIVHLSTQAKQQSLFAS